MKIRDRLNDELKEEILDSLFDLEKQIQDVRDTDIGRDIRTTIALARTQAQHDIASLAGWFSTLQSNALEAFDLKLLVATCGEIARKVYPRVTLVIEESLESDLFFDGRWFNPFVDILDILLQNAVRYSTPPNVVVSVTMRVNNQVLTIEIQNSIDGTLDIHEIRQVAKGLSETVDISTLDDRVQQEGNSGHAKLWNILTTDLGSIGFKVQCKVTNDGSFIASVELSVAKYLPQARDERTNS